MFVRSKRVKGQTYYQVIEGYRDEQGRVRHRNIISLGYDPTVAAALARARRRLRWYKRRLTFVRAVFQNSHSARIPLAYRRELDRLERRVETLTARVATLKKLDKLAVVSTQTEKGRARSESVVSTAGRST